MTTRSKKRAAPAITSPSPTKKRIENSWTLLAKDTLLDNVNFSTITLPHPAYGKPTKYFVDVSKKKIYEIGTFDEPYRSWFIGETVKSDGRIQMLTPVNPIFLVLPRLKQQCDNRAVPLEDLLSEKGFDKIIDIIPDLETVADLKGPPEMRAYKYNEDKTYSWLETRVHRLAKVLRQKNIHVTSGAVSSTFVTSNINNDNVDEEFYLKYAHGIVSEYLQEEVAQTLELRFNFKPDLIESIGKKRKSEVENNESNKKIKMSDDADVNDLKENISSSPNNLNEIKKEKPLTAKEKARQKAASGTKTISSFFAKK